jgi:ligand-binding sensor domain-containing protein
MPVEPPDTFAPGALEAVPTGSTTFGAPTVAVDGAVWGTGGGLSRFDPASGSLRTFTAADDPAFGDTWLQAPALDGGVWIVTDDVARRFDGEAFRETLAPGPVWEIAEGPDGTVWGTGDEGLVRWDGTSWVAVPADGLDLQGTLAVDEDGNVWVANIRYPGPKSFGVSRFDGTSWTTWTTSDGLPSDDVYTIVPGPTGEMWVGTADGVARFRDGSWIAYPHGVSGVQHVISMAVDEENVVIAGRAGGGDLPIARFDGSSWIAMTATDGLEGADSSWVQVGAGPSGMWATTDAGLFRMDGARWQLVVPAGVGPPSDTLSSRLTSVAAADGDTLWTATHGDGIRRLDGTIWTRFGVEGGLPSDDVNDVAVADDGTVWAATRRGLARFDGSRWEEVEPGNHGVVAVAPDGAVWAAKAAGTDASAGWIVGPVGGTALPEPARVDLDGPRSLVIAAEGDVWIGSSGSWLPGGLARLHGEKWTTFERPVLTPEYPEVVGCSGFSTCDAVPVEDIVAMPNGDVWVAFSVWAGANDPTLAVSRFDGASWHTFYRDAAGAAFVRSWHSAAGDLEVTPTGRLLFATGGGLLEFRDGAWHLVQAGDFGVASAAPDGTVWLGGDGLFRLPAS